MSRTVENTAERIKKSISSLARPTDGMIPSIRKLAEWSEVSKDTMHRVLKRLEKKGVIERISHSGRYRIRGEKFKNRRAPIPPSVTRSCELAERMQKDILSNKAPFLHGDYLSVGALSSKYAASRGTVAAALRELSERYGLVLRTGRRYRVLPVYRKAPHAGVYFLAQERFARDPLLLRCVYAAEEYVSAIGWGRLKLVTSEAGLPEAHRVAGLITEIGKLEKAPSLRYAPYPVTLLNRANVGYTRPLGRFREISFDNRHAGSAIARFLLKSGHRKVLLFTHLPTATPWVRLRIEGVREIYPESIPGTQFSMDVFDCSDCFAAGHEVPGIRTGLRNLLSTKVRERSLSSTGEIPSDMFQRIYAAVDIAVGTTHQLSCLSPLFRQALKQSSATAWICINDQVAFCAKEYLRRFPISGVQPEIVGFDNADLAITHNITSFDSGYAEMGRLAVASLANPRDVTQAYGETVMVKGSMVVR